jgi:hypothetical protein
MPSFRVKFINTLLSSDGHPFKVLQRLICIRRCRTADEAIAVAKRRFERLEHVADWSLHAQSVEVECEDDKPPASVARSGGPGRPCQD